METPKQVREFADGDPGVVPPRRLNEIIRAANALNYEVQSLKTPPDVPQTPPIMSHLFYPQEDGGRGEVYKGVAVAVTWNEFSADSGGDTTLADIGQITSSPGVWARKAIGINIAAIGKTTHNVPKNAKPYPATLRSVNADGTLVLMFDPGSPADLFRVQLSQTGGSDGTGTTAPSYTYTVTRNGVQLATGESPDVGRANGSYTAATLGIGYYDSDGEFQLLYAFEVPNTYECAEA
ncbi:hypothetical protein [Humisphaera borealis]|uniref:Uncharacterized protein n=1 Tax=Humisphaera borealis TaxID=2807512 RepID=A0A7M2X097_9BACT|nr:hypothetical protein [Humisphaera borealis]QOV91074.1 hypothetical protein IPV69_06860 [Humisphaera borealis]